MRRYGGVVKICALLHQPIKIKNQGINMKQEISTYNFITLLGQCIDHSGNIYPRRVKPEVIDQLANCAKSTLEETINSVGALGDLIFWSQQQQEPPEFNAHTGVLLQTLSDLMRQAKDAQEVAELTQNKHVQHEDGTMSIKYH